MTSRYGKKIRELEKAVLKQARSRHECSRCGKRAVKRLSNGIWKCNSCKSVFAGGAYTPETMVGAAAKRALKGEEIALTEPQATGEKKWWRERTH